MQKIYLEFPERPKSVVFLNKLPLENFPQNGIPPGSNAVKNEGISGEKY